MLNIFLDIEYSYVHPVRAVFAVTNTGVPYPSASEHVGDQMLGRQQLQEPRFTNDQQVAEISNAKVIRSKREAEDAMEGEGATKDPAERARIEKQIEKIRAVDACAPLGDLNISPALQWSEKHEQCRCARNRSHSAPVAETDRQWETGLGDELL